MSLYKMNRLVGDDDDDARCCTPYGISMCVDDKLRLDTVEA